MSETTITTTLILRRAPYTSIGPTGEMVIDLMFAKDTLGLFPHGLRARWAGPLAEKFQRAHTGQLRPGRGVVVKLHHLHSDRDEVCARISAAELAPLPPSWIKHQQNEQPA